MTEHKHIVNKQIIEIQLPKKADAHGVQQKIAKLYNEQFTPIIDKILCDRYGRNEKKRYQIDQLTIDLGEVTIENLIVVFTEKMNEALADIQDSDEVKHVEEEKGDTPEEMPLKVLSYFLKTGRLPWWSTKNTKAYLQEQLHELIRTKDATFKQLVAQLPYNQVYLDRFLNTFTESETLLCLQLLTAISLKELPLVQKEWVKIIQKQTPQKTIQYSDTQLARTLWKVVCHQIPKAIDYKKLIESCEAQLCQELGIAVLKKEIQQTDLPVIRSLVEKHKKQYTEPSLAKHFFEQLTKAVNHPAFYQLPIRELQELKRLLTALHIEQDEKVTDKLQPIARHFQVLENLLKTLHPNGKPTVIESVPSSFEDTDFITIQNAGLVLLWPFLQRFFENIEVMENRTFHHETARNKAVCALQYLCDTVETAFFEGVLPLAKVLCGVPLEDPIVPVNLSETEKEQAEGLLQAVIAQGPYWENLSLEGFRASYLCRQGSLRIRDGHWLLQVQKETYDITLEKLPWGIHTIKLPWMNEILLVEWN